MTIVTITIPEQTFTSVLNKNLDSQNYLMKITGLMAYQNI